MIRVPFRRTFSAIAAARLATAVPLALGLALAGGTVALAQSQVEVVVNDRPITSLEISERAALLGLSGGTRADARAELIDEELMSQEAERLGITVGQSQIDAVFANFASQFQLSPGQFRTALAQSGVNADTLVNRIRAQLAWVQAVQARTRATVGITEQDVAAAVAAQGPTALQTEEYLIQRVILPLPADASGAAIEARRREAESLRSQFTSCDTGRQTAAAYREVVIQNVGRRLVSELPGATAELLAGVAEGHLSAPEVTDQGIEMLAVCERRMVNSDAGLRAELQLDLLNSQVEQVADLYLRELRSMATIVNR